VQRRADTETDAARIAVLRNRVGDHLLLRRADANEGKPRRLSRGERRRTNDRARLLLQIHGRFVPADIAQTIDALQLLDTLAIAADNGDWLVLVDHCIEKVLGHVRS